MPDVNMPKLSDTMEEGTIVEWKKKTGDEVKQGDVLAEVESDKATFDLEAESGGVLSILVEQGVPAKIGAPIATIGEASAAPAKAESKGSSCQRRRPTRLCQGRADLPGERGGQDSRRLPGTRREAGRTGRGRA